MHFERRCRGNGRYLDPDYKLEAGVEQWFRGVEARSHLPVDPREFRLAESTVTTGGQTKHKIKPGMKSNQAVDWFWWHRVLNLPKGGI